MKVAKLISELTKEDPDSIVYVGVTFAAHTLQSDEAKHITQVFSKSGEPPSVLIHTKERFL